MEPSGLMDGARLSASASTRPKTSRYQPAIGVEYDVYDTGDEEVHFTRNLLPGIPVQYPFAPLQTSPPSSPSGPQFRAISLDQFSDQKVGTSADQVKSAKLLNKLGSKLRRGSNYLAAPKLVGQYLLGITIRNWSEFLNTARMLKKPASTNQLTRRLVNNLAYFQGNYMCISLILVIYCILTSPFLLLALAAYLAGMYFITARSASGRQLKFAGYEPNLQQQYSFLTLVSLPFLWVAGAPSAVLWVIGASFVVIGVHASMYNGERAFDEIATLEQQRHATTGGRFRGQNAPLPYYNHYPNASLVGQHQPQSVSLPTTPDSFVAPTQSMGGKISRWISFGRQQQVVADDGETARRQVPDVTIISQDFTGLGRVYEV